MKTIAFFNNKGGVGKTTLVYHLAAMIAERGERVLAVDLDPQANLTSMFLPEGRCTLLHATILDARRPEADDNAGREAHDSVSGPRRPRGRSAGEPDENRAIRATRRRDRRWPTHCTGAQAAAPSLGDSRR